MKVTLPATDIVRCSVDGCLNAVEPNGNGKGHRSLCSGHRRRKKRGLPVSVALQDPRGGRHKRGLNSMELLKKAALRFADVEGGEKDFDRAVWNLFFAARVYALSIGWLPPPGKAKRWERRLGR